MKMKYLPLLGLLTALSLTGCKKNGGQKTIDQVIDIKPIPSQIHNDREYFAVTPLNMNVLVGQTGKIDVSAIPSAYSGEALNFVSKNPEVATVDAEGNVTGVSAGKTKIEVSSKDGQCKETIQLFISEELTKADGAAKFQEKSDAITDPSFEKCMKIDAHEFVRQIITVDGKDINSAFYVEDIVFSAEDAYFCVYSDDIEIKTADGSPSVSCGKWEFFVDQESYDTYLLREGPTSKNYMEVHTQKYLGRPAYQIIYDVLDMFFVSGSDIVKDYLIDADGYDLYDSDASGDSLFLDCAKNEYGNATENIYSPNGDDLYATLKLEINDKELSPSTEYSIDIPAGTIVDETQDLALMVEGNIVTGFDICDTMVFDWNEKPAKRVFEKQVQYIRDFDVSIPDLSNYTLVDSIYDL